MRKWTLGLLSLIMMLAFSIALVGCGETRVSSSQSSSSSQDTENIVYDSNPENFRFAINTTNDAYIVKSYTGDSDYIEIPSTYSGVRGEFPVIAIGENAFLYSTLKGVKIPDSIIEIKEWAFGYMSNLTELVIPDSVKVIANCLNGCSNLQKLTVPFVGNQAGESENAFIGYIFASDNWQNNANYMPATLSELVITGGHTLYEGALGYCSMLTKLTLPESLRNMENRCLFFCSGLTDLVIPKGVTNITNGCLNGCSSIVNLTMPFVGETQYSTSASKSHMGYIFAAENGEKNKQYMPSTLRKVVLTNQLELRENAFYGLDYLTDIVLPETIESVHPNAFIGCTSLNTKDKGGVKYLSKEGQPYFLAIGADNDIVNADIEDGCVSILSGAFSAKQKLTSVNIPDSVTNIGSSAFYRCNALKLVVIPDSVTELGENVFFGSVNLETVTISNESNLYSIGKCAFYNCESLKSITLPRAVSKIGQNAFLGCRSLEKVEICDLYRYMSCNFDSVYSSPFAYATEVYFDGEKVVDTLIIPIGVNYINSYALANLKVFSTVTIPVTVSTVNKWAFYGFTDSQTIKFQAEEASYNFNVDWDYGCSAELEFEQE